MAKVYGVSKCVNEFLLDAKGKKVIRNLYGKPDCGKVIAYAKTLQGAISFLERYFDEEMDIAALADDKLFIKKGHDVPTRRLDYRGFNDDGPTRRLVSLGIITKDTILSDCL